MFKNINKLTNTHLLYLILLLNVLFLLPGLWVPYFNIDEITNAIHARFIINGELGFSDFLGNTYLLTHYLYAFLYLFVPENTLLPMHILHGFWQALTILALFWSGTKLADQKTGLWAALFYCVFSHCFMSKDFYTPSAESFSLLPAIICAGFVFRAIDSKDFKSYFMAGVFAMLATFFKAPMGVLFMAVLCMLVSRGWNFVNRMLVFAAGFFIVMFIPALFVMPFGEGFRLMFAKVSEVNAEYIQAYEGFPFIYWFFKLLIRSGLVLGAQFAMTIFALFGLKAVFRFSRLKREYWRKIFFLTLWLIFIWFTVTLGKRVFYHYFVFLLGPLSLLAAEGMRQWKLAIKQNKISPERRRDFIYRIVGFVHKHLVLLMVLPALIFFVEASFNFSTQPQNVGQAISYIKEHTKQDDRIYIWGNVPQVYFFTQRQPSTVYFWTDVLTNKLPGSPAMEYMRATNEEMALSNMLIKDFMPHVFVDKDPKEFKNSSHLAAINDNELLTLEEILERHTHYYWKRVFSDFLKNPPTLFIDSSPANIRGFGHFPIRKYELMKRFVADNYTLENVVDGMIIYRLKKS
jgi:hypothetical protein